MSTLHKRTPEVAVLDNRGLTVRTIAYQRHPETPAATDERITRHQYDARGTRTSSADPRLHAAGLVNFRYISDLNGEALLSHGVDNGTTTVLRDAAGRPLLTVTADGVMQRVQYESADLPGRALSMTEQVSGKVARITDRFVYAGNSETEKTWNLAGVCIRHYDTAGLMQTDSISLTGTPLSVTRRLLKDVDNPDTVADWQGGDTSAWNDLTEAEDFITLTTTDATGAALTTTDAKGNRQRIAYDVAGQLKGSWLTLKDGTEQVIVKSLTYSAAGQKLREEHGNGVVTAYNYEAETQRLTGIKTERPAGHAAGTKVLQDLRYEYDPVGNVLSIRNDAEETRFWRNQKVVPENRYTYDSLYQLVSATGREMANAGQQSHALPDVALFDSATYTNYTRIYSYDNGGNLTQMRHSPATGSGYTTRITVSDCSNRGVLSTLKEIPSDVDALFTAGGQQMQLLPGRVLSWTSRDELLKVAPVVRDGGADDSESYRYDAGSQRLLKVSLQQTNNSVKMQRVLYLPGLEHRSTTRGNTETESLQVVTMGEAGRAQVRGLHWESGRPDGIGNDQIRYSYGNLTGSSTLELDGDGNIISQEEYYPYGGTAIWTARSQIEANYKTVRYSGKERDTTGLYYYGYRYYQPWAGRWLSSDPAGTVDGLNLFRMCRNSPVTLYDPDGQQPDDDYNIIVENNATFLYRADGRSPEAIVEAGGFSNSLSSNTDGTLGRFENGETVEPIIYTAETILGMKDFANAMPGKKYFYKIDASGQRVARYSTNFDNLKAKKNITQHLKKQTELMNKATLSEDWTSLNDVELRKDLTDVSNDKSWMNLTTNVAEVHIIGDPALLVKSEDISRAMHDPEAKKALAKKIIIPYEKITYIGNSDDNVFKDESKHINLATLSRSNELSENLSKMNFNHPH